MVYFGKYIYYIKVICIKFNFDMVCRVFIMLDRNYLKILLSYFMSLLMLFGLRIGLVRLWILDLGLMWFNFYNIEFVLSCV